MADLVMILFLGPFYLFYFILSQGFYNTPVVELLTSVFGTTMWMIFLAVIGRAFSG